MWGAAIIVFREIFEIAIILCVILAATNNVPNRNKWLGLGIVGGIFGAVLFALITEYVASLVGDAGKLYFNAAVLFAAAGMIMWTVIWMKQHSRTIVTDIKQVSKSIVNGERPLYVLATVVGLAVMREGSEIVVFLYGLMASGETTLPTLMLGSLVGLGLGTLFGLLFYYGLLRISVKYAFQSTSLLLTFIGAGMAANAAGKLVAGGLLPSIVNKLWDTSAVLPQHGLIGRFLYILLGYQDHPNGMQVLFYLMTIAVIFLMAKRKTV